jgi:hypothetical protein
MDTGITPLPEGEHLAQKAALLLNPNQKTTYGVVSVLEDIVLSFRDQGETYIVVMI